MSRIHYPMTYSNYPFNAIRAIVKLSSATSRTFPATLTQKAPIIGITVSNHSRNTSCKRSCFQPVISILMVLSRVFSGRLWGRERASLRSACDYSRWMGAGGGAKLARRTPSELTKNTNCNCPLINRGNTPHLTITLVTLDARYRRGPRAH